MIFLTKRNFNLTTRVKESVCVAGALLAALSSAHASLDLTDNLPNVIDFTGYTGAGFAPSPAAGQLDSNTWSVTGMSDGDLAFGGTGDSGDFARGSNDGGTGTGGFYNWNHADINGGTGSFGIQPGGSDWTPGDLILRINNQTGAPITEIEVSYEVWVYNDQDRSNSLNFSHSADNGTYIAVPSLDYASPLAQDAAPVWSKTDRAGTLTGLNIAPGGDYYLRWTGDDIGGAGARDEFALDNISVRAVPEPSTMALLLCGLIAGFLWRKRRGA